MSTENPKQEQPQKDQFGDTMLGAGLGCAAIILAIGAALAVLGYTLHP